MNKNKIDILSLTYVIFAMGICFPVSLYYLIIFFNKPKIIDLLIGLTAVIIGSFVIFLYVIRNKGYKLKYFFARKKFRFLIAKALVKFNLSNYKFAQVFTKTRKPLFYTTGKIFYEEKTFGEEYRDPNIKHKIILLYSVLLKNIKDGTGFDGFIEDFKSLDFDSAWQAYIYMCNESISKELQYIISEVYMLTNFTFLEENTQENCLANMKIKSVLMQIFNPILMNFEKELEEVALKLVGLDEEVENNG